MFVRIILFCIGLFHFITAYADNSGFSTALTFPVITDDPPALNGVRAQLSYQPKSGIFGHARLYVDGSYGHWWLNHSINHHISIFSLAPFFRYYFTENAYVSPYAEISVGLSYLSKTHLGGHNLGMHFSFQDQGAIGASFGKEQKFSVSFGGLHYSNGTLCHHNRGMSIPLFINLGYRF